MERSYDDYKDDVTNRIESVIDEMKAQPVLFIGTGLSIRYFGAPNWENLLRKMAKKDAIPRDYDYYDQTMGDEMEIADEFAELYNDWAWATGENGGRDHYPDELFSSDDPPDIYLKHSVSKLLESLTPESTNSLDGKHEKEVELLNEIQPHAVITTNYDTFLEDFVFTEYETIVGQTLVQEPFANIGEIYKMHGCVTNPSEIVLTDSDYKQFDETKPYLSAKLLTFFTEHPVLIVGYRPNDPNVKRILSDVNTVLSGTDRQANIFLVDWQENIPEQGQFNQERLIDVGNGDQMVVNYIQASDFDWIFETFSGGGEIKGINSKLLRKLMRHTYDIVVEEAPRREISVGTLESVANDKQELLDILGIAPVDADSPPTVGEANSPSSIAEAGVPVGKLISNNEVDDLQDTLRVATEIWQEYTVLIKQRPAVYTFYNQREELDLQNEEIEFLFQTSLVNLIQGSEWLIRYDGNMDDILSNLNEILDGENIATLERNLLALGREEQLRNIIETDEGSSHYSNAEDYADICDLEPGERIKEYTGKSIRFNDEDYSIDELMSGNISVSDLLDDIISSLIENDEGDTRRALRKIEMVRIANSPLASE
ncbi:hypothetical protein EXE43_07560 [Halorubrum sp. SS5]|nr:hypothetical protein EXE43_07560 [Halorubrum sp. SS5]